MSKKESNPPPPLNENDRPSPPPPPPAGSGGVLYSGGKPAGVVRDWSFESEAFKLAAQVEYAMAYYIEGQTITVGGW